MKLAEALQERADLNRRISQLCSRLENNATVQEGETPAEDPAELLAELDACIARLQELIAAVNLTNSRTLVEGRSLTELIAERDCLNLKLQSYRRVVDSASCLSQRAARTEIRILSTVDVRAIQKQVDDLSARLRRLDNTIQENNWRTEL
mgnify:CR=1 FL=1